MSVEINQNTEVVATNEKEPIEATANQEADEPSGEFESIRMESEEIETEDIFIEDDIDKVFTFSSEETLFENDCDIMCSVGTPEKCVSTMESFITYGVKTLTSRASFPGPEFLVRRRFSDFEWLRAKLETAHPASIIPPLPEKHAIKGVLDRFEADFVKTRMSALEQFLARCGVDPVLGHATPLKDFLTLKTYDFNAIKNADNRILMKIGKNLKNAVTGQPSQVPNKWEDQHLYAERMADRLTKIERINERLQGEMENYKEEMASLTQELRTWEKQEDSAHSTELIESLNTMAQGTLVQIKATDKTAGCVGDMLRTSKKSVFPLMKEMNRYNQSVLQLLRRRNNKAFEVEKVAETLSLKRCDLENLRLNNSFSMINIFSSDPDRARAEKSAHLDYEIKRLESKERQLKEDLKKMETEMEENMDSYHQMRTRQLASAFRLFATSQAHFYDMAASAWYEASPDQYSRLPQ